MRKSLRDAWAGIWRDMLIHRDGCVVTLRMVPCVPTALVRLVACRPDGYESAYTVTLPELEGALRELHHALKTNKGPTKLSQNKNVPLIHKIITEMRVMPEQSARACDLTLPGVKTVDINVALCVYAARGQFVEAVGPEPVGAKRRRYGKLYRLIPEKRSAL